MPGARTCARSGAASARRGSACAGSRAGRSSGATGSSSTAATAAPIPRTAPARTSAWISSCASGRGCPSTSPWCSPSAADAPSLPPFSSDSKTLYGRYWGAIEHVPLLHFECCYYQAIEFAINKGLEAFEGGAQGEHKLFRGLLPVETLSAHW